VLPESENFQIGKAIKLIEGSDVTIFATGHLVWYSILAEAMLEEEGINAEVINIHTIKPLDEELILDSISKTGCAVTCEEHNYWGGLGESISRVLSVNLPRPMEFVAVNDSFGESGKPKDLLKKYGLSPDNIVQAVKKVLDKK